MTNLGSLFDLARRDLVLEEILNIIKKISCSGNLKKIITTLFGSIPKIILMLVVKEFVSNTTKVFGNIKDLFWGIVFNFLYSKYTLEKMEHHLNAESSLFSVVTGKINYQGHSKNRFPLFLSGDILYYNSWFHSKYVEGLKQEKQKIQKNAKARCFLYKKNKYIRLKASKYFPSNNYKKLAAMVEDHNCVSSLTESFSPLGILIDGEPGLGKSCFADFASYSCDSLDMVYRIDMSSLIEEDYKSIFETGYHNIKISKPSLFMIDEMDKYLSYRTRSTYKDLVKDTLKGKVGFNNLPVNKPSRDVVSYQEHKKTYKVDFLYGLLALLERTKLESSCVVVFCCNNFDTIFEGIDLTHFKSLQNRFLRVKFKRIQKQEMKQYLRYYNNIFNDTKYRIEGLNELLDKVPNDLNITYRNLHHTSVMCSYNLKNIVKELNKKKEKEYIKPESIEEDYVDCGDIVDIVDVVEKMEVMRKSKSEDDTEKKLGEELLDVVEEESEKKLGKELLDGMEEESEKERKKKLTKEDEEDTKRKLKEELRNVLDEENNTSGAELLSGLEEESEKERKKKLMKEDEDTKRKLEEELRNVLDEENNTSGAELLSGMDEENEKGILREKNNESVEVLREIKNNENFGDIYNTTRTDFVKIFRKLMEDMMKLNGKYNRAASSADMFAYLTYPGPLKLLKNDSVLFRMIKAIKEKIVEFKDDPLLQTNGSYTHYKKLNDELNLGIDFD